MTSETLERFYAEIHKVVGGLLYARNFYIAMLSADGSMLEFPYSVDERDAVRRPRRVTKGLTEYVLSIGKALLAESRRRTSCCRRTPGWSSGSANAPASSPRRTRNWWSRWASACAPNASLPTRRATMD